MQPIDPGQETPTAAAVAASPVTAATLQATVAVAVADKDLTYQGYEEYVQAEIALEEILGEQAEQLLQTGDLLSAAAGFAAIRDLNLDLALVCDRIRADVVLDASLSVEERDARVAQLESMKQQASALAQWIGGRRETVEGLRQRLQGNPVNSISALERAIAIYDEIPADSPHYSGAGLMRSMAAYQLTISKGLSALFALRLKEAALEFMSAQSEIAKTLSHPALDGLEAPERHRVLGAVESDVFAAQAMENYSALMQAVVDADFDAASAAVERLIGLSAEMVARLQTAGAESALVRLAAVDGVIYEGWRQYVSGELATDGHEWDSALQLLEGARKSWSKAAAEAVSTGLTEGRAIADRILTQTAVLLESAKRRSRRERDLNRRIANLETQLAKARQVNVGTVEGALNESVGGNKFEEFTAGGDINVGDVAGRDQTTISGVGGDVVGVGVSGSGNIIGSQVQTGATLLVPPEQLAALAPVYADALRDVIEALNAVAQAHEVVPQELAPVQDAIDELTAASEDLPEEHADIDFPRKLSVGAKLAALAGAVAKLVPDAAEFALALTPLAPFAKAIGHGLEEIIAAAQPTEGT